MKLKLNKGYWSIGDFFSGETNFNGDIRYNPKKQSQLLGGLQPLADLYNEIRDTRKPYKSISYFGRDVTLPIQGIGTMIASPFYILAPLFILAIYSVGKALGLTNKRPTLSQTASWMMVGALSLLTGALLTIPFGWLRIPYRAFATFRKKDQIVPLEQRPSVQKLIDDAENIGAKNKQAQKDTANICFELHRKFANAQSRNDVTHIEKDIEEEAYQGINLRDHRGVRIAPNEEQCNNYLSIFKSPKKDQIERPGDEHEPLLPDNSLGIN